MRIALVACASTKLDHPAPARDLYISDLFAKTCAYVEAAGYDRWYILSARYHLVAPDTVLAPYDQSLATMTAPQRAAWALQIRTALGRVLTPQTGPHTVDLFAGALYRADLEGWLRYNHVIVNVPLAGLGIGQQKRWLLQQRLEIAR